MSLALSETGRRPQHLGYNKKKGVLFNHNPPSKDKKIHKSSMTIQSCKILHKTPVTGIQEIGSPKLK
jgi:hypothetical protein